MREIVLRHFFEGHASAAELAADLVGTRAPDELPGLRSSAAYSVEPMARTFEVTPAHIVRLVDGRAAGDLTDDDLGTLCFILEGISVERFRWDTDTLEGARVADAIFWLGTPEINYPLTPATLAKIRHYLLIGENQLTAADVASA